MRDSKHSVVLRRTLASLRHQDQPSLSPDEVELGSPAVTENQISPGWDFQDTNELEDAEHMLRTPRGPSEINDSLKSQQKQPVRSGTSTPWNPHSLAMSSERGRSHGQTITRKLRQILGDFPVEDHEDESKISEARFQDPLWLIAGLAKRGWDLQDNQNGTKTPTHPTRLASAGLPPEESFLLKKWTPQALQGIRKEQSQYFKHGLHGSRSDVAQDLDPIEHGLVTEKKAAELFQAYWAHIHCQWAILDPYLHTLSFVRSRSALLTTTILALGSTAIAGNLKSGKDQVSEALGLHAHAEKLNLIVYETAARSIDIIQAQILLSRWGTSPRTRLDEQRWIRAAMIPRMATEIGLSRSRIYDCSDGDSDEMERLQLNDIRTRAFIIINEYRFFTYSGRSPMDLSEFELTNAELEQLVSLSHHSSCRSSVALYQLFIFDREVRRRLEQHHSDPQSSISLDAELQHVKCYIEKFIRDRSNEGIDKRSRWHIIHDSISCWLLLAILIARKRFPPSPDAIPSNEQQHEHQQLLLSLSKRLFDEAIDSIDAVRTTQRAAIFPVAASIVLRLSTSRVMVLRLALRMAGDPGRPYVPTFVREAGNQMLVMLCQNNLQSTSRDEGDNSHNFQSTTNTEHQLGEVDENTCNAVQSQVPVVQTAALFSSFGPSVEQDTSIENPHLFNFSDLSCLSEWADVPGVYEGQIPLVDPSCSWMNNVSLDCMSSNSTMPAGFTGDETAMTDRSFDNSVGYSCDTLSGAHGQSQVQVESSDWNFFNPSPTNTMNFGSVDGEVHNAQREALLSAVDRLMQLASLMQ
ncbi:hypothetical protein FSARC_5047 [Fusarium sarcochroum]|uniref:Xylanolytic transcriptional activator regulatory domain-containing protein n=1 Tax=Fusarium sarcochroum TaxID=1208366 RepID=A0A8H4U0N9_9HYPO|nr:hypothetical protein FSARC_5047 [Fusarium sarcochroum]